MLGYRIREILFGNWRNKGVALFFAVTIWFVAFRSEMQSGRVPVRLVLTALQEDRVIIRQEVQDPQGAMLPFDGRVLVSVSGARRQIQKLVGEGGSREVRLPVEAGANPDPKRLVLTDGSFPFTPPGVSITGISPDTLFLTFDVAEDRELPVEPIVQQIPEGMETEPPKIEPATVTLHGPRSVLEKIKVIADVWLRAMDRFDAVVPLQLRYPETLEKALVDRTVRFRSAQQARLSVRLRYKNDLLDAENVRVRFLIPGGRFPFRIQVQEETIAVRFQGPVQEIRRLREKMKATDFALAVVVPLLDSSAEQTIPFTEDDLRLYGFSERVQILQHPERQTQGKGAWTYSLIPLPAASPARAE